MTGKVTASTKLEIRISRWLRERGYIVPSAHWLEIWIKEPQKFLFFRWNDRVKIAQLFTQEGARHGTSPSKKWALEVYGDDYFERMKELARALSEEFKVDVHVVLESEFPREERDDD